MRTSIRMALATIAFGMVHSVLASNRAKQTSMRLVGERRAHSCYRLFFVGQSLLSFALLVRYGAHLPQHTIYRLKGPVAFMLHAGQAWALLELGRAAHQAKIARLAGWTHAQAWWQGQSVLMNPPVAQGPEMGADGRLGDGAAYRWSRHPLNFLGVPIFWFTPHLTSRRLAFNLVSTVYFMLGSWHEELRLKAAYGQPYQAYCRSGVPFFWPRLTKRVYRSAEISAKPALGGESHISPKGVDNSVDNHRQDSVRT